MASRSTSDRDRRAASEDASAAIAASHLGTLPATTVDALLQRAFRTLVSAGSTMYREGEVTSHLHLVVSGVVRVYVTALDGRTMTVRYCRRGDLIGVATLFATPLPLPVSIQALTDSDLMALEPSFVRDAAERDVRLARALIGELSERVCAFIGEIPGSAFATVTQRVARHLLDLASQGQSGPELVARTNQQALADAVGTVREVVARSLRELREQRLVATTRSGIALLDAQSLAEIVYPLPVVGTPSRRAQGPDADSLRCPRENTGH